MAGFLPSGFPGWKLSGMEEVNGSRGRIRVWVRVGYEEMSMEMDRGSTLRDLLLGLMVSLKTEASEFFDVKKGELHPDCQVLINGRVKTRELRVELKDGDHVEIERIVIAGG